MNETDATQARPVSTVTAKLPITTLTNRSDCISQRIHNIQMTVTSAARPAAPPASNVCRRLRYATIHTRTTRPAERLCATLPLINDVAKPWAEVARSRLAVSEGSTASLIERGVRCRPVDTNLVIGGGRAGLSRPKRAPWLAVRYAR